MVYHYIDIDIIVFTDTWDDVHLCNFNIPGFELFYSKVKRNQNDGIIIFVKDHLNVDFLEYNHTESNILKLHLEVFNSTFVIICVYRSPSNNINEFLSILENILDTVKCINGHITKIGDMNINIIGRNQDYTTYLDTISEYGFKSYINVFTRTPLNSNHSCLDHIFHKNMYNKYTNISAVVIQTDITDYYCTIIAIGTNTILFY